MAQNNAENDRTEKEIVNLDRMLARLDSSGVAQYVQLMQNTPKVLWLNFLSGIAKGLGFTVGTAIVLAVAYKIIRHLITMNIPYLTDMLQDLVEIIQSVAAR